MGSQLVAEVARLGHTGQLADLTPSARLVLVAMAATALDTDARSGVKARHYYGGWERLAALLGYGFTEYGGTPARNAERTVGRAMAELQRAGLIKQVGRIGPKGKRIWLLNDL